MSLEEQTARIRAQQVAAGRPSVVFRFKTLDGSDWIYRELFYGDPMPPFMEPGPPDWLDNPRREWPDPQGPITFQGTVQRGRETEAREAVAA